jgi:hypothetical protein
MTLCVGGSVPTRVIYNIVRDTAISYFNKEHFYYGGEEHEQ